MQMCQLAANVSTAYGKRRKWWEENIGPVPPQSAVGMSCGNEFCFASAHAFLRPKQATNVWERLFSHVVNRLIDLPEGGNIGIIPLPGMGVEEYAGKLRSFLQASKKTWLWRWSVRVREDGVLAVNKIGRHGSILQGINASRYDLLVREPVRATAIPCACGCGEMTDKEPFLPGHLRRAMKLKLCLGCGTPFQGRGPCCSVACGQAYKRIKHVMRDYHAY